MKKSKIKNRKILLSHGSGGVAMSSLIKELILDKFDNPTLRRLTDSAVLKSPGAKNLCFTTDSYVVNPLFFPGGDIGTLAINGTVNDLSVMGAKPLYISCSFILEEGLDWDILDKITKSMAKAARSARVQIVTGDTKVVEKGSADKVFINTSGVGILQKGLILSKKKIKAGDKIIINGEIGAHGLAVMSKRENFKTNIKSDCAPLWGLIESILSAGEVKFMRDPTRGGVATVLCEIIENSAFGIKIDEKKLPIHENVSSFSEILGLDPLYVANEGKVISVVTKNRAASILSNMKKHPLGKEASIIGEITKENKGKVVLETIIGGERIVDRLVGDQLPRIC
jgi:hydrogenase expression/formation protein HypE